MGQASQLDGRDNDEQHDNDDDDDEREGAAAAEIDAGHRTTSGSCKLWPKSLIKIYDVTCGCSQIERERGRAKEREREKYNHV